jgi:2-dehydro-3-deoxygalactonokinase
MASETVAIEVPEPKLDETGTTLRTTGRWLRHDPDGILGRMEAVQGASATARLIALDWGTTSLRAYLLGDAGRILDRRTEPMGILNVANRDFGKVLDAITVEWRAAGGDLPVIASGMIGSAQGWIQAPYVDAPAGLGTIARGVVEGPGSSLRVVPGVAQRGASADVMRGEETQIFGMLAHRPELGGRSTLVLPGTHSKWVRVTDGAIDRFTTYMTGELFSVLRSHSILGRLAAGASEPNAEAAAAAFARGVRRAADASDGLAGLLFSARSGVLVGDLGAEDSLEYLSGILIGDEVRAGLARGDRPDAIIGEPVLCARYVAALESFGVHEVAVVDDAAPAGLWSIASLAIPTLQRGGGSSRRSVSGRAN